MPGRIYDPGMRYYPPRLALAPRTRANLQSASGFGGFDTVGGGIDPGDHRFYPGVFEWQMHGINSDPGMGPYHLPSSPGVAGSTSLSQSANQQLASGMGFPHRAGRYRP